MTTPVTAKIPIIIASTNKTGNQGEKVDRACSVKRMKMKESDRYDRRSRRENQK